MEDNSLDSDKDEIMTIYFDLVNPYKVGPFHLIKAKRAAHYSPRSESLSFSVSPPSTRSSTIFTTSPPLQRGFYSSTPTSPVHSPRNNSGNPPPLPPRTVSLSDSMRDSTSSQPSSPRSGSLDAGSSHGIVKSSSKEPELSDRSSKTLKSMSSPRMSLTLGRSMGKVTTLPSNSNRERSRAGSLIESPKPITKSDELDETIEPVFSDESRGELKRFVPKNPTFTQRLKYNFASGVDQRKAEQSKSKKKLMFLDGKKSVSSSRMNTPTHSINSSPVLSGKKANEDFDYWNEIIEGSTLFLGMQPIRSNHPFLIDSPDHSIRRLNSKPFQLNPHLFRNQKIGDNVVVACVFTYQDAFEMSGGIVNKESKLDHNDFHQLGILNKWLPIPDETGNVNVVLAQYRLFDMMDCYLRGLPIYTHCKSGKGRSAMFKILFLAFCFLLDKRVAYNKAYLAPYIDNVESPEEWQVKRTRLCKIVERISSAIGGAHLVEAFNPEEYPEVELLQSLFAICEDVVKKDRKIKLGQSQRAAGLKILTALAECLYSAEITCHPKAKVPNHAFIDDLTQTCVLKNIHLHMDGLEKDDVSCKSFQEFLVRLVYNFDGWYEELVFALEGNTHIEGECGYFTKTSSVEDCAKRMEFLMQFRKEVEILFDKYPGSDYAKSYLAKKKPVEVLSPKELATSEPKSLSSVTRLSPRCVSAAPGTSPRVRSIILAKDSSKKPSEMSEQDGVRLRSRTFDKANKRNSPTIPISILSPRLNLEALPNSPTREGAGNVGSKEGDDLHFSVSQSSSEGESQEESGSNSLN